MKSLNRWLGLMLLGISIAVSASEYHFKFNHQDRSLDLPEYQPEVISAGTITINGIKMQAFDTRFINPREKGGQSYFRAKTFQAKVRSEHLRHFDLYAMPNGMVFVPKKWKLIRGGIGNNGSISYTFVPPNNGDGYVSFYHNAGCISCAMENGSLFFVEALKDAQEHDFTAYQYTNFPLSVTHIKPTLISYRTEFGGGRIDGIAHYNLKDKIPFWKAEVSLPNMQNLANPILNRFIVMYN